MVFVTAQLAVPPPDRAVFPVTVQFRSLPKNAPPPDSNTATFPTSAQLFIEFDQLPPPE
jgi:hypothetical protein